MREILFRGKDFETGEWIFGYYFFEPQRLFHWIAGFNTENIVDPKTVGQYTGLQDKDGRKIFEGDIVKTVRYEKFVDYWTVRFTCGMFCFEREDIMLTPDMFDDDYSDFSEVVGNIFENLELLEEGNDR